MEELGPGDGTSSHLGQTSTYRIEPLDSVLKGTEVLSHGEPATISIAFKSGWKQSLPIVDTRNGQILAVKVHRPTGQMDSQPQNKLQHFGLNDGPTIASTSGEKFLLKTSSFSTTRNISQQSHLPHIIVLNANNLSRSSNELHNQQQHVKIADNLPKDSIQQVLFTDFGVISAQAQMINFCQQNAGVPKDVYQQKYVSQKAIAVVTPLTQKEAADGSFSTDLAKVKDGGHRTKCEPNKKDSQPYIPHTFQSTTSESGAKCLDDSTSQSKEVPSKLLLGTGFSHCEKDDGLATNNKPPCSSATLPVLINSESVDSGEVVQAYPTNGNSAKPHIEDYLNVINSVGSKTKMNARTDMLSTIPVHEWSLQELQTLMMNLEQTEKNQQKDPPFDDLSSEILKLYWNGDYKKLCNAAKSKIYVDVMKDVRLQCGTKSSVILKEVSRERLNEIVSNVHILKHGTAPPKMAYTSSWLNLSDKLHDIDMENNDLPFFMTLPCKKTNNAANEVPVKEIENLQKPTSGKTKALSGEEEQGKQLLHMHQKSSSDKGDKMVRNGPEDISVNAPSGEETGGQECTTVKNAIVKRVSGSEQQNKTLCTNKKPFLMSTTQSSDVGVCHKKSVLLRLLTTDATVLDNGGFAVDTAVEVSTLSPENAGKLSLEVDNTQKEAEQILTDGKGQVTLEFVDQHKKHTEMEMKSDARSSGIIINWELENYCCLAKWFQVLGYRYGGLCKCEKKAELGYPADTSGNNVKEGNANKARCPFNKQCKQTCTGICVLQNNKRAKNCFGCKSITGKKLVTSTDADDASMNEFQIVDVVTRYNDVLRMANAMSLQLTETRLIARTSRVSTLGKKVCHKKTMTAKFRTGETQISLALFGSSHLRQKKCISGLTSSNKMQLPAETINVRLDSGWNEYTNSTKSCTSRQRVWNSWKKTYVPSKVFTNNRLKKRYKCAKELEAENDAAENPVLKRSDLSEDGCKNTFKYKENNTNTDQTKQKPRQKISLTRLEKRKKPKKRSNNANHGSALIKPSSDSGRVINTSENKLNMDSVLNFRVLPESFNIPDGSSTIETNQFANADSGSNVKSAMQAKRRWGLAGTWCESPRKKQCLKPTPTLPNTSGVTAFQEFKKKYEEKNPRIPP